MRPRSIDAKQKEKGRAGQVADGSRLAGLGAGLGHLLPPLVRRMPAKPSSGPPPPRTAATAAPDNPWRLSAGGGREGGGSSAGGVLLWVDDVGRLPRRGRGPLGNWTLF